MDDINQNNDKGKQLNSKNDLINKLSIYKKEEKQEVLKAIYFAEKLHINQKRASGDPYIIHPYAVAKILINLRLDYTTIIAAICHDVLEDTGISRKQLKAKFGENVVKLVDGVTKISIFNVKYKSIQNSETIRKMLFAMVADIRVILIKLADVTSSLWLKKSISPILKYSSSFIFLSSVFSKFILYLLQITH